MFRRACISLLVAVINGLFGFTGILKVTGGMVRTVFFILVGFTIVSLLLSLFDDADESQPRKAVWLAGPGARALEKRALTETPG
jgi:uncharacterized membrane protein YtjA (UPF0391 family)